jgi:hypothetical protein
MTLLLTAGMAPARLGKLLDRGDDLIRLALSRRILIGSRA